MIGNVKEQIFKIFTQFTMPHWTYQKSKLQTRVHAILLFIKFFDTSPVQIGGNWIFLENKSVRTTSISKEIQTKSLNLLKNVKVNTADSLVNSFIILSNKIGLNSNFCFI